MPVHSGLWVIKIDRRGLLLLSWADVYVRYFSIFSLSLCLPDPTQLRSDPLVLQSIFNTNPLGWTMFRLQSN